MQLLVWKLAAFTASSHTFLGAEREMNLGPVGEGDSAICGPATTE